MNAGVPSQYFTNEHRLIENIKEWVGSSPIGDDCALLPPFSPQRLLVTTDSLVEGTHFIIPFITFTDLGWKAIAVNLSDVAAMAGVPRYVLVSICLPEDLNRRCFQNLYLAMVDCARTYRTQIVGGDLTKGPVLTLSITVIAEAHEDGCLLRSGAHPGDAVVVTGDFGASAAGLWILQTHSFQNAHEEATVKHCLTKHVRPHPRLSESWQLVRKTGGKGALMDASDGLADALVQIGRASQVGMQIDLNAVPIHESTRQIAKQANMDPLEWALYGGEDYELVGCLPEKLFSLWREDNPFRQIGTVTESQDIELRFGHNKGPKLDLSRSFQQIANENAY